MKFVFGTGKGKTKPIKSVEPDWDASLVLVNKDKVSEDEIEEKEKGLY